MTTIDIGRRMTLSIIKTAYNSTFAKWRVEEVLVRSVFNITFVACRQVEVPNPPIRKSAKR